MINDAEFKQILFGEDELSPERIADEDSFATEMRDWLRDQADRIAFAASNGTEPSDDFWKSELELLIAFLALIVIGWVEKGISAAVDKIGTVGLGVSDRVNAEAERWARRHAVRLARGLNLTTRQLARQRIAVHILAGQPGGISGLTDSLNEIISPRWRAEMIAQTEITRAFGEAHLAVAKRTDGVKALIWHTRRDERVCPVCSPLHGKRQGADGTFSGFRSPPAHPRCRCDISIEVKDVKQ